MTEPTAAPEPVRSRNRLVLVIAVAIVLVVASAVTWAMIAKPGTFELRGTMTLTKSATAYTEGRGACVGYRGYDDLGEGAQVTVYNASGEAIALGKLADSVYSGSLCIFQFTVQDVPGGEDIYQVEVSHRGKVSFPSDKARSGEVALSIG